MEANSLISDFSTRVDSLYEVEYGDFKRKVSQYLIKLEGGLRSELQKNPEARKIVLEMRNQIIYDPQPDIERGRLLALGLAIRLKQALAHP